MATMGRPVTDPVVRFVRFIVPSPDSDCWLWDGALDKDGYGWFPVGRNRHARAARVAWEMANGRPLGEDMTVDHLCFRPSCIRPSHLEEVTMLENLRRRRQRLAVAA